MSSPSLLRADPPAHLTSYEERN